jgi:septum formation protein
MFPDKVFLASKSPRRLELLSFCFRKVEQIQSLRIEPKWEHKESAKDYLKRCIQVKSLGAEEAYQLLPRHRGWHFVVAADTIVVLNGEIFGKPDSPADAEKMLGKMVGREHEVLTSYSVSLNYAGSLVENHTELLTTKVKFRKASKAEIRSYVKTGEPLDKSGSYGVQGPALQFVESIQGSYQSVMGIPLFEILKLATIWEKKHLSLAENRLDAS